MYVSELIHCIKIITIIIFIFSEFVTFVVVACSNFRENYAGNLTSYRTTERHREYMAVSEVTDFAVNNVTCFPDFHIYL
jgi:hypothetical protein